MIASDHVRQLAARSWGTGPDVVLLHGLGASARYWDPVAGSSQSFHGIAPDLLGFGRSPKPRSTSYGVDDHADAVLPLVGGGWHCVRDEELCASGFRCNPGSEVDRRAEVVRHPVERSPSVPARTQGRPGRHPRPPRPFPHGHAYETLMGTISDTPDGGAGPLSSLSGGAEAVTAGP